MNLKLDVKTLVIAGLLVLLSLSLIFRPSKPINKYETEINALKNDNLLLRNENNQLTLKYDSINKVIVKIDVKIKASEAKLDSANKVIVDLKNKRGKIPAHVNSLKTEELVTEYDEYFKRRFPND